MLQLYYIYSNMNCEDDNEPSLTGANTYFRDCLEEKLQHFPCLNRTNFELQYKLNTLQVAIKILV